MNLNSSTFPFAPYKSSSEKIISQLVSEYQKTVTLTLIADPKAAAGLNISQLALSDWTQGGENALTWTIVGTGGVKYATEVWGFTNDLKVAYGRTKLGSEDFKTNDNELYLESVLSRNIGWDISPYFSNTVRTALTAGYNYDLDPKAEIANFLIPAI